MQERFLSPFALLRSWRVHRTAGGLMAKAAYEPLDEHEQSFLDRACTKYPGLEEERRHYASFVQHFKLTSEELPLDLSSRLNILMHQPPEKRHLYTSVWATSAAVAVLVLGVYLVVMVSGGAGTAAPKLRAQTTPAAAIVSSPDVKLANAMNLACGELANKDAASAAVLLEQAIEEAPQATYVGDALLKLADLEFNNLQRYERAFTAYDRLQEYYPEILAASQEGTTRYNLLSEVRRENYYPLYVLDFARSRNADPSPIYEKVVATYPDTVLAGVAMDEMCTLVKAANPDDAMNVADELELVRARCSNPITMAQVDLTLGHHYCNALNDRERAMAHYNLAAASDHIALAHEAAAALSRMK